MRGDGAGGIIAPLLNFRLDAGERRNATQKALSGRSSGVSADLLRELGESLQPGTAVAAVLVDHPWRRALEDAVARTGGTALADEFVATAVLDEVGDDLLAATRGLSPGGEAAS